MVSRLDFVSTGQSRTQDTLLYISETNNVTNVYLFLSVYVIADNYTKSGV
jgi:hypothetical protein